MLGKRHLKAPVPSLLLFTHSCAAVGGEPGFESGSPTYPWEALNRLPPAHTFISSSVKWASHSIGLAKIFVQIFPYHLTCIHAKSLQLRPTLQTCGLLPARLLGPWDSPGKNTGVGCHALLQGGGTQGSNLRLLRLLRWQAGSLPPAPLEMATRSSILVWKILWTEEPGRLQSTESQRVRHN